MAWINDEKIAAKIAKFLAARCPAFVREDGLQSSVWHGCLCRAQPGRAELAEGCHPGPRFGSCTCVWHKTSMCEFAAWDMPFLRKWLRERLESVGYPEGNAGAERAVKLRLAELLVGKEPAETP